MARLDRTMLAGWLLMWSCAAWASSISTFHYMAPSLGHEQTAEIYRPEGPAPPEGWPVLYLLHGLGGAASDWQRLGNIGGTLDRLIANGDIRPVLVVMPYGANSWYVDSAEVKGPGDYAAAIGHDLPVAIENAFPVGRDRAHRAIAGLSMGGFGALRLALAEPDRYSAVAALSPAIWQNVPHYAFGKTAAETDAGPPSLYFIRPDADTVTIGVDLPPAGDHFGGAFGTPFDPHRFNAENVFTLLENAIESQKTLPGIFLTVGDDDSHLLWRGAIAFFETMQMNRRPIEFRVTDGDHNWSCWKTSIVDALKFIDKRYGTDQPKKRCNCDPFNLKRPSASPVAEADQNRRSQ